MPTYRTLPSPHRYSDGRRYGRIIARKLGRITSRWQQYVLDVGAERVDGPKSPLAYHTVIVIVGRRGGKTVTELGMPLARSLEGPITLDTGKVLPFSGTHMAQNLVKAKERFQKDLIDPYQSSMSPAMWRAGVHLRQSLGDTELRLDPAVSGKDWRNARASTITVSAPTMSSVRGDGLLHIGMDEVLVFTAEQGAQLLSAARPTMATLRGYAQMWLVSNVTVINDSKTWLYQLRELGRAAVESGRTSGIAYFEFTIPDDVDPLDEQTWWDYYPGLSDGLVRPEELQADLELLGPDSFAAEYLGRWPGEVLVTAWAAIAKPDWYDVIEKDTALQLPSDVPTALTCDVDIFGRSSSLVATTEHPKAPGVAFQELIDHRPGSGWVVEAIQQLEPIVDVIGLDDYGSNKEIIHELESIPAVAAKLVKTTAADFAGACYAYDARVREHRVRVRASDFHETLTTAVSAAQRTRSRSWQYERRVAVSQTPLVAATLGPWALGRAPTPEPFFVY